MSTIDELLEEYRIAVHAAAEGAALVEDLDEQRRIIFSRGVVAGEGAVQLREHQSRASAVYVDACDALSVARQTAAKAEATAKWLEKRIMVYHSRAADRRTAAGHR